MQEKNRLVTVTTFLRGGKNVNLQDRIASGYLDALRYWQDGNHARLGILSIIV